MKPKKGEAHAEMDEPLKNPLQLVKELVLLIVEARTPDLSVKGRVEGPHCPVIRGRLAHKCNAEKAECVRASEFCYLAQRLWMNSVPVCLDILLFPNCIHGQEEASVTEGTVSKLSQENALLAERWTIDGSKRRQDDCLSSSMLIQAVRSYLHFSQISSWLYSTGGKLPGLLAYRVYAPGEVTSLDFLQTPDIHNFPVCLASFDHIRVTVSSLQRQANVPILVCLQDKTMGNNSREAHCKCDITQQSKSRQVKVRTVNDPLKDFTLFENSDKGSHWMTGVVEKTYVPEAGYSTKIKTNKQYMKALPETSAHFQSKEQMYGPSLDLTDLFPSNRSPRTRNTFSYFEETSNKHIVSNADISRMKSKNGTRLKTSNGGDDEHVSGSLLYAVRNCIINEDESAEISYSVHTNPELDVVTFTPDFLEKRIKSSDLNIDQGLLNQVVTPETSFKSYHFGISQDEVYSELNIVSHDKKRQEKERKKGRKKDVSMDQLKVGLIMDQKLGKHIGDEQEDKQANEIVDIQTLIRNKKKAEYSKFKKSLDERQSDSIASFKMWSAQTDRMKELAQNLFGNNDNIDGEMISPKQKVLDITSFHSRDKSALYNKISSDNKLQATKKNISENEASEELIRILSDRLSMITVPQTEMCASLKSSSNILDTEVLSDHASMFKNVVQGDLKSQLKKTLSQSNKIEGHTGAAIEELTDTSVKNSKLCQLNFEILEDSDNTPIASPNHTPRLKSMPESLKYTVRNKLIKHNYQRLHSQLLDHEAALDMTEPSGTSKSESHTVSNYTCDAHGTIKGQELNDSALMETQPLSKKNVEFDSDWQKICIPGFHSQLVISSKDQIQQTDQKTICQPVKFAQCNLCSNMDSQNEVIKSNKAPLYGNNPQLLDNRKCLKESNNVNEDPISVDNFICNQDLPKACSRRFFEENLLPLVSYDADSDSFRKVEELYNSNILHSPKVLFSCDVPSTKVASSRKCIDFGDTFEAEFFRSKLSDLVDPEAIGKYMSNLATLSGSVANGKEDQDEDTFGKQVEDLVRHGRPSNLIEMSSQTDYSLKQQGEVDNVKTLCSTGNYCLIKTQSDNDCAKKGKPETEMQSNGEVTEEILRESLVNNGTFNHARRQLNLSYAENAESINRNKEWVDERLLSADDSLLALPCCLEERALLGFTSSKNIAESFPPVRMVTLSPPLSSSCTSSSSTSSVQMISGSLSPTSPTTTLGISSACKQSTYNMDNGSKDDNCVLCIQESLCTCSPNVTAQQRDENTTAQQRDENTTALLLGRKSHEKGHVQTDISSSWRSSDNTEFLTFVSLHSTSISPYLPPPLVLQSLPTLNDATHKHLCHNNSHTSLSKVIEPHPLPHDDADCGHSNSEPEAGSPCECQTSLSVSPCNQKIQTYDLDSQMALDTEVHVQVPALLESQTPLSQVFDVQSSAYNHEDTVKKKIIARSSKRPVQETASHEIAVTHAQTFVTNFSEENIATADSGKDSIHPSITTQSSLDPLPGKTPSQTEIVETFENQSDCLSRELSAYSVPVTSAICSTVQIEGNNTVHKPKSETLIDDIHGSKQKDQSRHDYNNSVPPVPKDDHGSSYYQGDIDSLREVALSCNSSSSNEVAQLLATCGVSEDLSISHQQSQLCLKTLENCSSFGDFDNNSRTRLQNGEQFEIFCTSCVEQQVGFCTFGIDQETTETCDIENSSEVFLKTDKMLQQHSSLKIIQTSQDSKNGFEVKGGDADKQNDDNASGCNKDVVFYLSETESKMNTDPPLSLLSNSLQEDVLRPVNYKVTRPSSLSAEVTLEMRLRSNPGITNKSNLDFSDHSKSPPYHCDPPGWSSVPPHRTVSTPSCMDREIKSQVEKPSSDISVIQQHNCDHVIQTGLRRMAAKSVSMIFNNRTGLPTQSSPAPLKRKSGGKFDYDVSLLNTRAIKNAFSCSKLASNVGDNGGDGEEEEMKRTLSTSAPASTNCLLGNFEESILNGRIDPVGTVDGFTAEIGASGSFCPKHLHLPVSAFFFALSDDNAPSPYLGHINLESVGKKGYHIPKKGTVQVTLFNPNKTVVKMFVVVYDLSDMPASSQTFIRQRTVYSPIDKNHTAPSYLRYLIHLRCASSHSRKIYLHTDIRLIFARHKLDIDAKTVAYELKSYTEGPQNPKYSPKK